MKHCDIRPMTVNDWPEVARIYESGIATGQATFEKSAPDWESWDKVHRKDCRLIACLDGQMAGWAALSPVSGRCVFSGVAEVSIYIDEPFRGRGVGDRLLAALILESEAHGIWTLQSGIFPENAGSLRLHQKHGFRMIGTRERMGNMDGVWRDVVIVERRSAVVGIE